MKSYTDLEQSRKLAEIVSIDTADMWYDNDGESIAGRPEVRCGSFIGLASKNIPCWSLAALLGVLPNGTRLLKSTNISSIGDVKYYCDCPKLNIDKWFDNSVDVCVAMIMRLNELNLL